MDKDRYQLFVGRLIYLSHIRPDNINVVSVVSHFLHSPCVSHMLAVYHILRCSNSSANQGLYVS